MSKHGEKKQALDSVNQPQLDPRMLAAMYGMQEDDEIDLLEYWNVLWKKKWLIVSTAFLAAVIAAGISLTMPNIYKAEVLLSPVSTDGKAGGLSSALGSLGGLASLAGVSMPSGGNVEENLAVLKSREFLWSFINDKKLMPILFEDAWDSETKQWQETDPEKQPSLWDAYRLFVKGGFLSVSTDKDSGLVHLSVEWTDAGLAAQWSNELVLRLNQYLRQKAIEKSHATLQYLNEELAKTQVEDQRRALFELISQEQKKAMLANTQKQFAFQIIDKAVAPDKKSKPKRALIVILTAFVVGFLMVILVFIREGIEKRKEQDDVNG